MKELIKLFIWKANYNTNNNNNNNVLPIFDLLYRYYDFFCFIEGRFVCKFTYLDIFPLFDVLSAGGVFGYTSVGSGLDTKRFMFFFFFFFFFFFVVGQWFWFYSLFSKKAIITNPRPIKKLAQFYNFIMLYFKRDWNSYRWTTIRTLMYRFRNIIYLLIRILEII